MPRATGTFEPTGWDETSYSEVEGGSKLTRAHVTSTYAGDLEGTTTLEYLMAYRGTSGSFVGFEHLTGTVGGRSGTVVLRHDGTFAGDTIQGALSIVPGSGTGSLDGITGAGSFVVKQGEKSAPYTLDFELG